MFGDGALCFQEYMVGETVLLGQLHQAVLDFLRGRDDTALFGAQAVNAYVNVPRMTQDVDVLATQAAPLADALRAMLARQFHIAVRVREVVPGIGFRIYQLREQGNRHLVDVRQVAALPPVQRMAGVQVVQPAHLLAMKVMALVARKGQPKSGTDWRDIAALLLTFPALKIDPGPVGTSLAAAGAAAPVLARWADIVREELVAAADEDDEGW
jgi:hypothetical protein